eukprot:scaffold244230_cov31-Tisochrysis_lutea.AAC.1
MCRELHAVRGDLPPLGILCAGLDGERSSRGVAHEKRGPKAWRAHREHLRSPPASPVQLERPNATVVIPRRRRSQRHRLPSVSSLRPRSHRRDCRSR